MTRPRHLAAALATAIAMAASPAAAEDDSLLETASSIWTGTVDVLLIRPLAAGRLAIGAFVAMPLSSTLNAMVLPIGQDTGVFAEDWDRFVVEPTEYLFVREVGKDMAGF